MPCETTLILISDFHCTAFINPIRNLVPVWSMVVVGGIICMSRNPHFSLSLLIFQLLFQLLHF